MYFNGLGEQDEEIRHTIGNHVINYSHVVYLLTDVHSLGITNKTQVVYEDDDLVSSLELCIRPGQCHKCMC